jgi:hypothetical protein
MQNSKQRMASLTQPFPLASMKRQVMMLATCAPQSGHCG